MPDDAAEWFDTALAPGEVPTKFVIRYYYDASMGNYIVVGDYFPEVDNHRV
ncbi:MAG: hypothetical protein M3Q97_07970 [Bacteroidota bacterium]|nr:hypothetical protein [Bacteroidota bacterium]